MKALFARRVADMALGSTLARRVRASARETASVSSETRPCFPQVMRGVLGLVRDHRVVIGVNYATLFVNASGARLSRRA